MVCIALTVVCTTKKGEYTDSMKTVKLISIVLFALQFNSQAMAAPVPGTTSSKMVAPKLGIYKSKFGFEIMAKDTAWMQTKPPRSSRFIETVYRSPIERNNVRPTLTVRVDNMKNQTNIKKYVRRWIKEYPKYGYDVLGSKSFKVGNKKGYVIDLVNSRKKRQLRQVIYLNKKIAVLLTCRDHSATFSQSLKECNNIVKNFKWTRI